MKQALTFLTKGQVKRRGWTEKMVAAVLGEPDALQPNPWTTTARPLIHLYLLDRVEAAEQTDSWRELQQSYTTPMAPAEDATEHQARARGRTIAHFEAVPIDVHVVNHVVDRAIESHNRHPHRPPVRADSDSGFLDRITVNLIRHELTPYDEYVGSTIGTIGGAEAREILKSRVLNEIARAYPEYAHECANQLREVDRRHA